MSFMAFPAHLDAASQLCDFTSVQPEECKLIDSHNNCQRGRSPLAISSLALLVDTSYTRDEVSNGIRRALQNVSLESAVVIRSRHSHSLT